MMECIGVDSETAVDIMKHSRTNNVTNATCCNSHMFIKGGLDRLVLFEVVDNVVVMLFGMFRRFGRISLGTRRLYSRYLHQRPTHTVEIFVNTLRIGRFGALALNHSFAGITKDKTTRLPQRGSRR